MYVVNIERFHSLDSDISVAGFPWRHTPSFMHVLVIAWASQLPRDAQWDMPALAALARLRLTCFGSHYFVSGDEMRY